MQPEAGKYLYDALKAAESITVFIKGQSFQEYSNNLLLRSAVERQFEVLGEAFNKLDASFPEYRQTYPDIGKIIGMRNRIIHGYDSVDHAIIWDATRSHLPALLSWLKQLDLTQP